MRILYLKLMFQILNNFIDSLKKLDSMIGMKDVKRNIISQIKYYFVNKSRKVESLDKQEFFHTTLLGPPGSGKTTVAEHLADIWMSLGVLNPKNKNKKPNTIEDEKVKSSKLYTNLKKDNENISKDLAKKERRCKRFSIKT
jgi:predicted Ser/Thr protein kinase